MACLSSSAPFALSASVNLIRFLVEFRPSLPFAVWQRRGRNLVRPASAPGSHCKSRFTSRCLDRESQPLTFEGFPGNESVDGTKVPIESILRLGQPVIKPELNWSVESYWWQNHFIMAALFLPESSGKSCVALFVPIPQHAFEK
jgi:hypothetical protein